MNEADLINELVNATADGVERDRCAVRLAAAIRRFGNYRWVGIYDVNADEIAVLAWDGPAPPKHQRFPQTEGLCGAVVAAGEAVVVDDVEADPRYLTTHTTTRSEIIVPVFRGGIIVGLIDVESEQLGAFTHRDVQLLERCAAVVLPLWRYGRRDPRTPRRASFEGWGGGQ